MIDQTKNKSKVNYTLVFIGILFISMNLRAPFTSLPPLVEYIQQDFNLSMTAVGALTTLPLLAFAVLSPMSARIAGQYGIERSLFGALVCIAVGIIFRSLGFEWSLFFGTAMIGIGIAVGNVLLPSLVKRDFPNTIAKITGIYALTMGLAAALASSLAIPLVKHLNWQFTLLCLLILPILAMVIWFTQLSKYTPPSQTTSVVVHGNIWRSSIAWQVTLFLGFNSTIYYIIISWLPSILIDKGLSVEEAGSLHGVLQLATALPGLLIIPLLSRLKDQRIPAVFFALLSAIALIGFWLLPQFAMVWSVLFGLGTGAGIILGLAFIGLRTHSPQQAAALSGMSQCIGYLLAASGPMLIGNIHSLFSGWTIPLIICIILALLIGAIGLLIGRNRQMS